MAHGFNLYNTAGTLIMNIGDAGGVFVERLVIAVGSTSTKTYNADARFSGRVLRVIQIGAGSHDYTLTTSGGYPHLTWTARATHPTDYRRATTLFVFAT
jgi:hypothetical protein